LTPVGPNTTLSAGRLDDGIFSWASAKLAMAVTMVIAGTLSFTESLMACSLFFSIEG
jgi:hypothetical protein